MFQASTTPTQSTINLTKSLRNDVRRRNTMSICTTFECASVWLAQFPPCVIPRSQARAHLGWRNLTLFYFSLTASRQRPTINPGRLRQVL